MGEVLSYRIQMTQDSKLGKIKDVSHLQKREYFTQTEHRVA